MKTIAKTILTTLALAGVTIIVMLGIRLAVLAF